MKELTKHNSIISLIFAYWITYIGIDQLVFSKNPLIVLTYSLDKAHYIEPLSFTNYGQSHQNTNNRNYETLTSNLNL